MTVRVSELVSTLMSLPVIALTIRLTPCFADLYLDIVAIGDVLEVLDRDELDEALETGDITREEYDHAISVCRKLYAYLAENQVYIADWCDQAFRELKSACTKEWIKEC